MDKITRLPAMPLITHDPYFSIWSSSTTPTASETSHWTGVEKSLTGTLTVDGVPRRFMGRTGRAAMKLVSSSVTPLSTEYVFEALGARLKVRFTSPLLLDDLDILSTPITYVNFDVSFTDGRDHTVMLALNAAANNVHSGEICPELRRDFFAADGLRYGYMGQMRQKPLSGSGDHLSIDWGYLFFCSTDDCVIEDPKSNSNIVLHYHKKSDAPFSSTLMIAYDDVASINYFGRLLPAYYARNGKTITEALAEFHAREEEILARCDKFDKKLLSDAKKLGGKEYALLVSASYRQSIAAHKLVADLNGDLLFISKEDDSNGCAATVDVSYPSVPLYLLYNPELVRAMCRPIFKFTRMPIWHYDFAPHDVGRYPVVNGQIYAAYLRSKMHGTGNTIAPYYLYPATVDAYRFDTQMPVEECGNMLLMVASVGYADGNWKMAEENLDLLRTWCKYLVDFGEDPGDQLCTDDFAGHLARNVNLSAKAVMGVAAYAMILEALGKKDEAASYMAKARAMGESWLRRADVGGCTALTFNGDGWSQKYNLVWDKLFGLNILPDEFYRKELASYVKRLNPYGLPLDSRCDYTKSDWTMWTAAMADDKETFCAFVKPLARFLTESESRVPFSDFYDTATGLYERFIARSVQGGIFMPLLMQKWQTRRNKKK